MGDKEFMDRLRKVGGFELLGVSVWFERCAAGIELSDERSGVSVQGSVSSTSSLLISEVWHSSQTTAFSPMCTRKHS